MKKVVMIYWVLLLGLSTTSHAQETLKEKRTQFGFSLGIDQVKLQHFAYSRDPSQLYRTPVIHDGRGYRLGILSETGLTKHLFLAQSVQLAFHRAHVLENRKGEIFERPYLHPHIEYCPKLVLRPQLNLPYCFVGPAVKLALEDGLGANDHYDIAINMGIGFNQNLKSFVLAPELHYSYGLRSIGEDQIQVHSISFTLNFKA